MLRNKQINVFLKIIITWILIPACENNNIGYIEIRNQTDDVMTNVEWGGIISFGTIYAFEEKGKETEISGDNFVFLEMNGINYRSKEKITIDAGTSATLIVKDTTNLIQK